MTVPGPLINPESMMKRTYIPAAYADGRFRVLRLLATAGQGYTLLVEDTWTRSYGVLKGIWWERNALDDPRRSPAALAKGNGQIRQGAEATRRVTQLNQQAPVLVSTIAEPSPALRAMGHPDTDQIELFAVQQFVGAGNRPARTLLDLIKDRKQTGRRFSELELLDLAGQLCDTLGALHGERKDRERWVHADLKPGNILVLGPPWRYLLIDYDGAVEQDASIYLTTDEYAPPKLAGRDDECEHAKPEFDIYMFGATLAEAAGLQRLEPDVQMKLYGTKDEHTEGKQALRRFGYGPILTTVIATCLASPQGRFRQVSAIAADLALARNATVLSGLLTSDDWN